mgnify:FL=1
MLPFEAAQVMLLTIARRFRFGVELEDTIKAMKPPQSKDDGKQAAEQMKMQMQAEQMKMQLQHKEAAMTQQVKTLEAEKTLAAQQAELALRELTLKTEQEVFRMEQQMAEHKLAMKETTFQTKVSATDKVRSIKDAADNKELPGLQQTAKAVTATMNGMQQNVEKLAEMQVQLLRAVSRQSDTMQQQMTTLLRVVGAPRKKKAIRGKDGRIESVEETVMAS